MSRPQPGTYVIYNRVLSPSGDKLAITFNGQGVTATVTPLSYNGPQKVRALYNNNVTISSCYRAPLLNETITLPSQWIIADFGDGTTQSVTPTTNSSLQAAWGANVITVLPAGNFVWTIRSSDSGYTIKDGGVTVNWGVAIASGGANVTIGSDTGNEKQRWIFERV